MIFEELALPGVFLITLQPHRDDRGFFARTFCQREFERLNLPTTIAQSNLSHNEKRGTLRGMHYQKAPHQEAKLLSCTQGALFDVVVDLRPASPTRHKWISVELTAENRKWLFIPKGLAHGFLTLVDNTNVFYQMFDHFHSKSASGFRWDDPKFAITWPESVTVISERDRTYPDYLTSP